MTLGSEPGARAPTGDRWRQVMLQECVDPEAPICYGILKPGKHVPGGVPVVKVRDLANGRLRAGELLLTDPAIDKAYRRSRLREGDLLLSIRGTAGTVAVVPAELDGANITQDTARIRVRADVDGTFIEKTLRACAVQNYIRFHTIGQAVRGINIRDVRRIPVALPQREEQARIGGMLHEFDRAIGHLISLTDAKRRFKRGLMQELLTGKRRFKEFARRLWAAKRLGDLFSERAEKGRTDLLLLSITSDRGVIPRDQLDRRDTSNEDKAAYLRIAPGDVGYNTMRMWQGVSALSTLEGLVSPAYTICVPGPEILGAFAAQLFKLPQVIDSFRRHSQGLVDDTLSLKFNHFAQIRVNVPPIPEQRRIADVLEALDHEIALLTRLQNTLDRQRRGVAELLLTGKVRAPEAAS